MNTYMNIVSGGNLIPAFSILVLVISAITLGVFALQEKGSWDYKPTIKRNS